MKNRRHRLFAFILLCAALLRANGQDVRVSDSRSGLTSNYVMSLYQDNNGYLWAGTYTGLSILGGNNEHVIYSDRAEVRSLAGSMVLDIQ